MKKNKNRRNKNHKRGQAKSSIPRQLFTVIGVPIPKLIITQDIISSSVGSTSLTISPSGAVYWNLSSYATTTDWLSIYSAYQLFRIRKIKVVVSRVLSEQSLTTVYPNGMANVHVAFYPINASYSPAASFIVGSDNSLRISPFTNRQYTKTYVLPNMLSTRTTGGVDYTTNPSQWTSTNLLSNINGCFCVGALSPSVASSSSYIFAFETYAEFEFACPY